MSETKGKPPRFILPPNVLKQKVGEGGIPADRLTRAQTYIKDNNVDFSPEGKKHLSALAVLIAEGRQAKDASTSTALCEKIILEVMQLKAHGGMFHYGLVSMVSDVVLQFLERVKTLNTDVFAILGAYTNTMDVIFENEMRGDGGEEGMALAWELEQATERYRVRHFGLPPIAPPA